MGAGLATGATTVSKRYTWINHETSLATGKLVAASSIEAGTIPENAVGGEVRLEKPWRAAPIPQWLQVDLQGAFQIGKVAEVNSVIYYGPTILEQAGLIRPQSPWYARRPIMITRNDYNLKLFNGMGTRPLAAPRG